MSYDVPMRAKAQTTAERIAVTWGVGVFVLDTTLGELYVGDGSTAGGLPAASVSSLNFIGAYDASTGGSGTPSLLDGTGTTGDLYRVSVAGTVDHGAGSIAYDVGDLILYDGANWQKDADAVISVAGKVGVVTLDTDDVTEATALYYTEARVSANVTVAANATHAALVAGNPHVVTAAEVGALPLGGGTMAGTINMDSEAIDNVGTLNGSGSTLSVGGDVNLSGSLDLGSNGITSIDALNGATLAAGGQATTAGLGIIELATQAEVDAGSSTTLAVTPSTLANTTLAVASAASLVVSVQKGSAGTISVGNLVYISGFDVGQGVPEVELADSDAGATMPAFGIAIDTLGVATTGEVVVSGLVTGLNTGSFTAGDDLYVSGTAGALTATKPTGTALIQKVAVVTRSHASLGSIEVFGAGRSNDVPNIPSAQFWVGNGSAVATPVSMSADATMDNTGAVTVASASDSAAGKIEIATQTERNTGTSATLAITPATAAGTVTTITNAATPYTLLITDSIVYCDTSGGVITVNLPASAAGARKVLFIRAGGSAVTLDGSGAETVGANQGGGATAVMASDGDTFWILDTNKSANEWVLI